MKKSLQARNNDLANTSRQLEILSNGIFAGDGLPTFAEKIRETNPVSYTHLRAHET